MKEIENERRDWIIVVIILLFGLLLVTLAGQWAVRFAPRWQLNADMGSKLDPNSSYLTNRPHTLIEAVDPSILTAPVWMDVYLTPDAVIPTRVRPLDTPTATLVPTRLSPTNTGAPTSTPTSTVVYVPSTATSNPANSRTPTPTKAATATSISTSVSPSTPTVTPTSTLTSTPTNTSTPTSTPTSTNTPTSTPTNTPLPLADLRITITDYATSYDASTPVQYIIVVSNSGPSGVTGALASGGFSPSLTNITWSCTTTGGATCGNITAPSGDLVDMPAGSTITYTVNAMIAAVNGELKSTVSITPPIGITETDSTNNSATDIDSPIVPDTTPANIGTAPDSQTHTVPTNTTLTLQLSTTLVVSGGNDGWDLIYYELPQAGPVTGTSPGIWMDHVILQVGDGRNWYTILNWGDHNSDGNASMNLTKIGASQETDNLEVDAADMYNLTGIGVELDKVVPNGSYTYLRIISPTDSGDGVEVDAIVVQ